MTLFLMTGFETYRGLYQDKQGFWFGRHGYWERLTDEQVYQDPWL